MTIKGFVLALATVLVPALTLSSCGDDEENNQGGEEIIEIRPTDGLEFVKNCWVLNDANGNFVSFAQGRALNEAEPTVAYVGVKDMDEAKENFANYLVPRDAKRVETGDNITVTLTDTLGKEVNKVLFTAVSDGETFATVKLEKKAGIEKYVTEYRYIDRKLWPENSVTDDDFPFQEGAIYTLNSVNYVCIKVPEAGQNGILFTDCDEWLFCTDTTVRMAGKHFFPQFPSLTVFKAVDAKLLGEEGDKYLKLLNTCSPDTSRGIKDKRYWTSTYQGSYFYEYKLTAHTSNRLDEYDGKPLREARAKSMSGEIVVGEGGDVNVRVYHSALLPPVDYSADVCHRNTTLEEQALSK